jgi:hypothetical protein
MDVVKHWPSWANWCARDEDGAIHFWECEPASYTLPPNHKRRLKLKSFWLQGKNKGSWILVDKYLELVEIDPDTTWHESKQRRNVKIN